MSGGISSAPQGHGYASNGTPQRWVFVQPDDIHGNPITDRRYGIWAPAQTPAGIVSALARDIADTLATAELSQWLTQHDADPMRMSPAEFGAFVVSEAERAAVLLSTS